MLTVNQLTLTQRKDLTVLVDSLSFTLNDGERLALIGEEDARTFCRIAEKVFNADPLPGREKDD